MVRMKVFFMSLIAVVAIVLSASGGAAGGNQDYWDALHKCLMFFEGQRSGKLPSSQRLTWRKDSALFDGSDNGVDLVGGYYDAGDNVKYTFPMAFSTTMLAWSVVEFGDSMGSELSNALDALRWGTDFLLKATTIPNKVFAMVGVPTDDHNCWERPEDMDTSRRSFAVDADNPGSEVAGETAAALAAASIAFKASDPAYSNLLLSRATSVFDFANTYRGNYMYSLGSWVCPFYCDFSGYEDELVWAAAWIHKASGSAQHWKFINDNIWQLGTGIGQFGWDDKHGGIFVLLYKDFIQTEGYAPDFVRLNAETFVCSVLPESPSKSVQYTSGGLMYMPGGTNMQHVTNFSYLLLIFARYLTGSNVVINCGGDATAVAPWRLIEAVKGQVDYVLGDNPLGMSYMVGYGLKFPQRIHHRGSSMPSISQYPDKIECKAGTPYYQTDAPNPNLLIGALTGGPVDSDEYPDVRQEAGQSEPTTYYNAAMVGLLAHFCGAW